MERETLVELVALSAVASEHLLVIGPPGTAKSEAVRRVARALGGSYFEYLLGLARFKRGVGPLPADRQPNPETCWRVCHDKGFSGYQCGGGVTWP